jgi:aminopeptidase N
VTKSSSRALLAIALCLAEIGAAHQAPRAVQRADEDNLTREFARFRKSQVNSVDYELEFSLDKGSDEFSGRAVLNIALARTDAPLSIDFLWKKLGAVRVNGTPITDLVTRTGSFDIPAKHLRKVMRVEIEYQGTYNKEGQGIQRVVDPEDGSEYVYTDFEAYYAHGLFPSFDQPDLKATYTVSVVAPSDWTVIANGIAEATTAESGRMRTRFPATPRLSPYLFFLGAGPFAEWKDALGETPLRLYARKTLAAHVDATKLFTTIKQGLAFYSDYFARPYPFAKFALVFIPEFSWGGMENPGAITVNERFLFRGPVPRSEVDGRDNLILHEMAHMWFGDLVTMAWWNDLWLNESFASYLSNVAQDRALQTESTWLDFFGAKTWGYWQDQLVTTHPIETDVADVRSAKGNFDGITYAKGAAVLKQLHYFVGEDGFRGGLRSYFAKFAFGNTSRADFVAEIARASGRDLDVWTKAWLQTAGPNRVRADWSCDADRIQSFRILQSPSSSGTLSPHRTLVGLFRIAADRKFELLKLQGVTYSGHETTVGELKYAPCPDFVYPNLDDQDFALFALDPVSLKGAQLAISGGLAAPLPRLMIWHALAQMVRDTELPIPEYFETVLAGIEAESDPDLLGILLARHSTPRDYYYRYLTKPARLALAPSLEQAVWNRVIGAAPGSSLQMTLFDFYPTIAQTPGALARIAGFLAGEGIPNGIVVDQDRRWSLISALAAAGHEQAPGLIEAEPKRDPTTVGQRNAYAAKAALPDLAMKLRVWQDFQKPDQIPFSFLRAAAGNFHNPNHVELSQRFVEPLFSTATSIDWSANDNMVEIFLRHLFPGTLCSPELLRESAQRFAAAKNLIPLARRAWLEANEELSKCIAIRRRAGL